MIVLDKSILLINLDSVLACDTVMKALTSLNFKISGDKLIVSI